MIAKMSNWIQGKRMDRQIIQRNTSELHVSPMSGNKILYLLTECLPGLSGLSFCFNSPVALIFTPVANLLLYGWSVSTTGQFTCDIKHPSNILGHNRCYGLLLLWTALAMQVKILFQIKHGRVHAYMYACMYTMRHTCVQVRAKIFPCTFTCTCIHSSA